MEQTIAIELRKNATGVPRGRDWFGPAPRQETQMGLVRGISGGERDGARRKRYQMTRTAPDARMSASRVSSGTPSVRAAATMSASNGSRVKRRSSAW